MTSYTTKSNYPYPDPTDAVTDYPATAATLAGYLDNLPNRNRIINGTFDIWQRGTSFSNPATGAYIADRWRFAYDGAGATRSMGQIVTTTSETIGGMKPRYYLQIFITNAGTATTQTIGQRVEDVRTLSGETVTFSAYVKTNSGTMTLTAKAIQNFGTGGSPSTAVTTTLGTGTANAAGWTRLSWTATLPSISGKTIGTTGDDFVELQLDMGNQTGTLNLWGVQLEQGSTRTALERRPIQQELALCQRYYYRITSNANGSQIAMGAAYSGIAAYFQVPIPSMRIVPTSMDATASTADYGVTNATAGGLPATSLPSYTAAAASTTTVAYVTVAVFSGLSAGNASAFYFRSSSGYLGFAAEL